jgi:SAM-dependent methyltransferase
MVTGDRQVRGPIASHQSDACSMPDDGQRAESQIYARKFFAQHHDGSVRSAQRLLPIVFDLIHPRSVIDVGCGIGTWLSVAQQLGVSDFIGLDGDYVDRAMMLIPEEKFIACDLNRPLPVDRPFDMAICVEVVEHLPALAAPKIVADLVRVAPVIIFSAAAPGQGGDNHLNEQWPEYWQSLFALHSYRFCDFIRPRIWNDSEIECWYRQNAFVVAADGFLGTRADILPATGPLARIHPDLWDWRMKELNCRGEELKDYRAGRAFSGRTLLRLLPAVFGRSMRHRLTRFWSK